MVTRIRSNERGASTLGCGISVLLFLAVLYYGAMIGPHVWNYYSFKDEMNTAARFAQTQTDPQILRVLAAKADEIGLPPAAKAGLKIRRTPNPQRISISTQYNERIDLPLLHRIITFRPQAEMMY